MVWTSVVEIFQSRPPVGPTDPEAPLLALPTWDGKISLHTDAHETNI